MLERYEGTDFHVADVGHRRENVAARDVLARAMQARGYDTGKRCANVGAPDLVIDLLEPHLDQAGIGDRQVPVRDRLLELELRNKVGTLKLLLPAHLAVELPDVDLGALEQDFLFGSL